MITLPVTKIKWTRLIARIRASVFFGFSFTYLISARKVTGTFEKRTPGLLCEFFEKVGKRGAYIMCGFLEKVPKEVRILVGK